jgi:hypothetical protein
MKYRKSDVVPAGCSRCVNLGWSRLDGRYYCRVLRDLSENCFLLRIETVRRRIVRDVDSNRSGELADRRWGVE